MVADFLMHASLIDECSRMVAYNGGVIHKQKMQLSAVEMPMYCWVRLSRGKSTIIG